MRRPATLLAVTVLVTSATCLCTSVPAAAGSAPAWRVMPTATVNRLVIADVVDRNVVWAVGGGETGHPNDGSVVRTTDGGRTWQNLTPPGGAAKVFRDVEATDGRHAIVLAVGPPSQIYRTADGGATWQVVFEDPNPDAFYDCVAFFDHRRGLAVSDPVGGRFRLAGTEDGGRSWHILENTRMPPALAGESALATGTCLQAAGQRAWFGTATPAGANARVFATRDGGRSWSVATTPLPGGGTGGIRSLSFRDPGHGVAVGGDPPPPGGTTDTGAAVVSADGGRSWSPGGMTSGFRNGVSWVPGHRRTLVAVGTGSDVSTDGGRTWQRFDGRLLLGVDCRAGAGCWAVGRHGRAAKLSLNR